MLISLANLMSIFKFIGRFCGLLIILGLSACQAQQPAMQTPTTAINVVELGRIDITQARINYDQRSLGVVVDCASLGTIDMVEIQYRVENMQPAQVMGGGPTECKPNLNLITISPQFRWPLSGLPFRLGIKIDRPTGSITSSFNCQYAINGQTLVCSPE